MSRLLRRLSYLVNQRRRDAELAEELALHRELSSDAKTFGSSALAQNQVRDVWIPAWLQDAAQDVRFALRMFANDRVFTLIAAAVLAIGIGVDNTLLMAVNAACLRGLPIARADQVLFVGGRDERGTDTNLSFREFETIRAAAPAFLGLTAHASSMASIGPVGDEARAAERALLTYFSTGGFALLGVQPMLGRDFTDADHQPGAPSVTILGGGLWTRHYGADPAIVGRAIRVNGAPSIVIGVIQAGFKFPRFTELWQPLQQGPSRLTADLRNTRGLELFGRLRDGRTLGDARSEIEPIAARLAHDFPETNQHITFRVVPINDRYNQSVTDPSWVGLMIVGAIVLLIACANAANLLLMRSAQRSQEFAIRASLGASRLRLVRQLLIECAVLASLGGTTGWGLATVGGRLLTGLVPETQMPFWIRFTMDGRMLVVLSLVTLATVFVFGLAPALQAASTDVNRTLKNGARTTTGGRTGGWTNALLIAEFALTVVLVTMLIKGERIARAGERRGTGYDSRNVVSGSIVLSAERYPTPGDRLRLYDEIDSRLAGIPAVGSFAFAGALPGGGAPAARLEIDGQPHSPDSAPQVWTLTVGPRYFDVLGVALLRGRPFDDRDGSSGAGAAIVNQEFVDRFFPTIDPIGRRIRIAYQGRPATAAAPPWLTIAAIAPTLRQRFAPDPDPIVYLPLRGEAPAAVVLLGRASARSDTAAVGGAIRDVVRAINPDLPIARLMPMDQAIGEAQWAARGSTRISETVVLIAILLAAVGLYAVTAHAVVLRTGEISVRRALGARAGHIIWMVWRRASIQIGLGGAIGVIGGIAWEQVTGTWFLGTGSAAGLLDPVDFVMIVAVVAIIGMVGCIVPAWRAVQLDPLPALRRQ